jgi:small subunit ribosomal protein S3Ae
LKKEWWTVRAPGMFSKRDFTISPVNQTAGEKLASDNIKGRVYTVSLGDLSNFAPHKKVKLIVDEEADKGSKVALTNFYGLDTTRDHTSAIIKKWHSTIESFVDAKTTDGFLLRVFIFATTKKKRGQQKATSYAQQSQVKQIRKIIQNVVSKTIKKSTLKDLVPKLLAEPNQITEEITTKADKIFPIQNCIIRKVKTIKRAKFDIAQLLNIQTEDTTVLVPPTKEDA